MLNNVDSCTILIFHSNGVSRISLSGSKILLYLHKQCIRNLALSNRNRKSDESYYQYSRWFLNRTKTVLRKPAFRQEFVFYPIHL